MFHHLVNLFWASISLFFSWIGTTPLGFIALVFDSVASIGLSLWRIFRKQGIDAMRQHWKENAKIALQTTFLVMLATYGLLFVGSIGGAIYKDHQWQVTRRKELENLQPIKDAKIHDLESRLTASCYNPDRRITNEQRDKLYEGLRKTADKYHRPHLTIGYFECGDRESINYASTVADILRNAGFILNRDITRKQRTKPTDPSTPGVQEGMSILLLPDRRSNDIAMEIVQDFGAASVRLGPIPIPRDLSLNEIIIWVGYKPQDGLNAR